MNNASIRRINTNDFQKIIDLIKATHLISFKNVYSPELTKLKYEGYTSASLNERVDGADFFVAENASNEIIGLIGLKDSAIRTFFVHPSYQGKGIGRKLFEHIERLASKKNLTTLKVESSVISEPVYAKFGFVKTGEHTKDRKGLHYTNALMEKSL